MTSGSAPAGTPAAPVSTNVDAAPWIGIPKTKEEVEKVINPKGEAPYSGKTGTLKGRVIIKGDAPPEQQLKLPPKGCGKAQAAYGRAFRVGADNAAIDALVAVTGYEGFVPAKTSAVPIKLEGCAFDQGLYTITYGQRLELSNVDPVLSYMPYIDPAPYRALMVAMPRGNPVRLYAHDPAVNYVLRDMMDRPFLTARLMALKFSTHDVTDGEGRYEISGIPVGKVNVDAVLPAIEAPPSHADFEIKEGENALDFELNYDAKLHKLVPVMVDPWKRDATPVPVSSGKYGAPPLELPPPKTTPR